MADAESSAFQSALPVQEKLERARMELLDLSARNRLLSIPKSKTAKHIEIVDERSEHVYRLLVREGKTFTFIAGKADKAGVEGETSDEDSLIDLAQPEETEQDHDLASPHAKHIDTKMQTRMTPKGLQKRLLDLYHDSRTLEEEQGVNILFLALGTLKWIDPNNKENIRFAPLVLAPVALERGSAGEKFRLKVRQEEQTPNLSLEAYLDKVHRLKMPTFDISEDFNIAAYMSAVAEAVETKTDWAVQPNDITLGFFSFAKFLMYRDLDPENWPADAKLSEQAIVKALLTDGFNEGEPLIREGISIDPHIPPAAMLHIVDSDSSQALAVHDVRNGRNLVIQGPPGTGKSQTIANVIASAVADGKTVLFVAEKMAALDVVKRRLDQAGVGDACLELHSNKANKRALLDELRRTWELGAPRGEHPDTLIENLSATRDSLNGHASRMHAPHGHARLTPYQVLGHLVRLRRGGQRPTDIKLERAGTWTQDDFKVRLDLVKELVQRIEDIGQPAQHPWRGVGLEVILPTTIDRLIPSLNDLEQRVGTLLGNAHTLSESLGRAAAPSTFNELRGLREDADIVAAAPDLSAAALSSPAWDTNTRDVLELIRVGLKFRNDATQLVDQIEAGAVDTQIEELDEELAKLPASFPNAGFAEAKVLHENLPKLLAEVNRLSQELGSKTVGDTFASVIRLADTGERVAAAPNANPEAFAATVWEHGVEQAADLVDAVITLERIRASAGSRLLDAAWDTDVKKARQTLATQTGFLRFFSGQWRSARALARSIIKDPDMAMSDVVKLLDELTSGQAAIGKIRSEDAFGRSAFGADWRSERSSSVPLIALVEWMKTLRGLGAEPRILASQLTDRIGVGNRALQVRKLIDAIRPSLTAFWSHLESASAEMFDNELSIDRVLLASLRERLKAIVWADDLCAKVLKNAPGFVSERRVLIQRIQGLQALSQSIGRGAALGEIAFGGAWKGRNSNWGVLQAASSWLIKHAAFRRVAAKTSDRAAVANAASQLATEAVALVDQLNATGMTLEADTALLFRSGSPENMSIATVHGILQSWIAHPEQLSKWVAYQHRANKARASGLRQLVERLSTGEVSLDLARPTLEMAYYEGIMAEMVSADADIARFDGDLHARRVKEFSSLDKQRIKAASFEVARAHHRRIPSKEGGAGPVGILRGEMARRRGHMPIRQLMSKAGPVVQALKPVMMMSPLSVAQFLIPGKQTFDLLVMDEASQIQPVDAIGAIARCKQVVVVGDERQLPPTRFFSKLTEADPDEDQETTQVADIESILGLFVARGLSQRMLRWHYRSRHQSLIAVSNSQFYENKLFIVPSPYTQEAGMGLLFHLVPDGIFDSGGTGTNAIEAKAVAQAILKHAKSHPELSLGVATFSVSQRRAIQDELELLRRLNPNAEDFFHAHPSEPFFVKNLENVQGDERDVIIISVGYAKNAQGYMAMRFGPLGADGGERRLNVLISRAKRRCEVYSSITDEDIDLDRGKGKGVFAFKLFLHYARTGRLSVAQRDQRDTDSVFEEQVADALQSAGYQVHPQVGIAGFFIDLAIADPNTPGRYLIGIECDGAAYHSARSARDRDRLRQAVLEDHGWIIHRIWSTDWFQRPDEQLRRTVAAIEAAKLELEARLERGAQLHRAVPVEIITVDRGPVTEVGLESASSRPLSDRLYVEATPQRTGSYELHETPLGIMADLVAQIVAVESPIHIDEVITRLRTAWGLQRAGGRIEAAVEQAVSVACANGNVARAGKFLLNPAAQPILRDRQSVQSQSLRKPEMIAPTEIAAGVIQVVGSNLGATDDEIAMSIARMVGFKATGGVLRKAVSEVVGNLLLDGTLSRDGALIVAKNIAPPK